MPQDLLINTNNQSKWIMDSFVSAHHELTEL